jgi:hypothetical protein
MISGMPRNTEAKEQKCTAPAFIAILSACLSWAFREPCGDHITRALDMAQTLADENPGEHPFTNSNKLKGKT